MKKVVTTLTALTLALCMTACAGKDDSSTLKVGDMTTTAPADTSLTDTSGADNSSAETEQFGKDGDITGSFTQMNITVKDDKGREKTSMNSQPLNINKGLRFDVQISLDFSKESVGSDWEGIYKEGGINADVQLFCNGQVIKHSLDENAEASEKTTVGLNNGKGNVITVYVPPTELGNIDESLLCVCVNLIPEYIPESPRGEITMFTTWYVPVTSSGEDTVSEAYEAQENDYIYSSDLPKLRRIDIGKYDESSHSSAKNSMDEVAVIDKDSDFAVTANLKDDNDYYLAVFCDGELINAFDGKPLMKVNCQGGKRMVKYSLDKESLPENGDHAYSVMAIATEQAENGVEDTQSDRRLIRIDM